MHTLQLVSEETTEPVLYRVNASDCGHVTTVSRGKVYAVSYKYI